jgi:WD40 repeat protein
VAVVNPLTDSVDVYDRATGDQVWRYPATSGPGAVAVTTVSFSSGGAAFFIGTGSGEILTFDVETWELSRTTRIGDGFVRDVAAGAPDGLLVSFVGSSVVYGLADQNYVLFDTEDEWVSRNIYNAGQANLVNSVAWSGATDKVVFAPFDGDMVVFDPVALEDERFRIDLPFGSAVFSEDGAMIFLADILGTMVALDAESLSEVYRQNAHRGPYVLAPDPLGRWVATGGITDGDVKLWDAATGEELTTLRTGVSGIRGVWFTPDGSRVGFLTEAGVVDFLETNIEALLEEARSLVPEGRALNEAECLAFFGTEDCG